VSTTTRHHRGSVFVAAIVGNAGRLSLLAEQGRDVADA
jgi:hypothetical protein